MNKLHSKTTWLFRIEAWLIILALSWFIVPLTFLLVSNFFVNGILKSVGLVVFTYLLFILIFGELYSRMTYNRWFYQFGSKELKLERGIIWKSYTSIPYERIQNIDIRRGITARIFGFSSIMIQTAGFSGPVRAEGYIPGVSIKDAEKIRDFVIKKIKHSSKSGL